MNWHHVAALAFFTGAGAFACWSITRDVRHHWPAIARALGISR